MALQKLTQHRRKIGPQQDWVQVVYRCPQTEADAHAASLWETIPAGFSGRSAPIATGVKIEYEHGVPDKSRITAVYRTPSWDDYCLLHPNKFVLRARAPVTAQSVKKDLDGNTIEGADPTDTTGMTTWTIDQGKNVVFRPKATYVVRGLVTDRVIWFDQWTDDLGKVNETNMSHFGKHQQDGKLLFAGMNMVPHLAEDHRWWITYLFMAEDKKWNINCIARKHTVEVHQIQLKDADGALITGEFREVRLDVPTTTTRTARLLEEKNFTQINGAILW